MSCSQLGKGENFRMQCCKWSSDSAGGRPKEKNKSFHLFMHSAATFILIDLPYIISFEKKNNNTKTKTNETRLYSNAKIQLIQMLSIQEETSANTPFK